MRVSSATNETFNKDRLFFLLSCTRMKLALILIPLQCIRQAQYVANILLLQCQRAQ